MKMEKTISIFLLFFCVNVLGDIISTEDVKKLTPENFDETIKETNLFVMFHSPHCKYCKELMPNWEKLAKHFHLKTDSEVVIAQVDCTVYKLLCSKYQIAGYPTLLFFPKDSTSYALFNSKRTLQNLFLFISKQMGEEDVVFDENAFISQPTGPLLQLTDENFNKHISLGKHFIKFYAPWCEYSQKLAPLWEELANSIQEKNIMTVCELDCTKYRHICKNFDIDGYPTLLWVEDGKKVDKYNGTRSVEDLQKYILKMTNVPISFKKIFNHVDEIKKSSSSVIELTSKNVHSIIQNGLTFVNFYGPLCLHCRNFEPIWTELGTKFLGKQDVKIAQMDCRTSDTAKFCSEQNVRALPTLKLYKNGEFLITYQGSLNLLDLYEFINKYIVHEEL